MKHSFSKLLILMFMLLYLERRYYLTMKMQAAMIILGK